MATEDQVSPIPRARAVSCQACRRWRWAIIRTDVRGAPLRVCQRGQAGKHVLNASFSHIGPEADGGRTGCFTLDRWGNFLSKVCSHNENPDRYAAAICIRVRSDGLFADILLAKAAACPCCETLSGPQMLSGCYEVFVERLLLFLLGCLLGCLFCLLRFLGHVALRDPKNWFNASRVSTRMNSEYTTIAKLILPASKRVNERHAVATCDRAKHSRDARPLSLIGLVVRWTIMNVRARD